MEASRRQTRRLPRRVSSFPLPDKLTQGHRTGDFPLELAGVERAIRVTLLEQGQGFVPHVPD